MNDFLVTFLLFTLLFTARIPAFFYSQEMISVPKNILETYQKKHHISAAFQTLFDRGLSAYTQMDFKRAQQVYNTLLLINSRDIIALDKLAQTQLKLGEYKAAKESLNLLLRIEPLYYPAHNLLALLHLYTKEYKTAIHHAKFLIESSNSFLDTYLSLVNALFFLGQFDNADSICKIARNAGANHPHFHFVPLAIDLILKKEEDYKKKRVAFFKEFSEDPDIDLYAYVLFAIENNERECQTLARQIRKKNYSNPVYPFVWLTLALDGLSDLKGLDHIREYALTMSDHAIKTAPDFLLPYRINLEILRRGKNYNQILLITKDGIQNFPHYRPFYEFRAEAGFFLLENQIALEALEKLSDQRLNDANLLSFYAILLLQKDQNPETALEKINLATGLEPENPYMQTAMGYLFFLSGEIQRAELPLRKALKAKIPYYLPYELMITIKRKLNQNKDAYTLALNSRELVKHTKIYTHAVELAFERQEYRNCGIVSQEAIRLFEKEPWYRFMLAKSLEKLNQPAQALTEMDQIGFVENNPVEYNIFYLNLLLNLNEMEKVEQKARWIVEKNPRNHQYQGFLANFYYQKKDLVAARNLFHTLVENGARTTHLGDLGWMDFLLGKEDEGIKNLSLSASSASDKEIRARSLYRLGLIYALDKKTLMESSQAYSKGFEFAPHLKEAKTDHLLFLEINDYKNETIIREKIKDFLE